MTQPSSLEYKPVERVMSPQGTPSRIESPGLQDQIKLLFSPDTGKNIVLAAENKAIGSETFQRMSHARVKAKDKSKIALVTGSRKLIKDNLTFHLKPEDIPAEYRPYLSSYPIQLAMSVCDDVETFEKFVHLTTVSLSNAETAARQRLDTSDREKKESFPAIGKRLTKEEDGYKDQVARKCRILDVLSRRYAMTEVEGDVSVMGVLKEAASLDTTAEREIGVALRKDVKPAETDFLAPPERRPTAPAFRLFPLQQKAFDGTDIFEGMLPYFQRTDVRGAVKKVFALILPTGVGKTVTAAELISRLYHRGVQQLVENSSGQPPPALLFIAPQRVLVTQAAKELHAYLSDLYGIQMDSSIIIGGKKKDTNWAFIQKAVAPYKQEVMVKILSGEAKIPEKSSLAGKSSEELYTLLLSHWEDVMELSSDTYLPDVRGKGEIPTDQEVLIHDLRRLARENGIIDDSVIREKFQKDAYEKIATLAENVRMQKSGAVRTWSEVSSIFASQGNGDNGSGGHSGTEAGSPAEITSAYISRRLAARWADVLSPFKIDDSEVNALRAVVKKLNLNVPPLYKGLLELTLECQNGMIRKPDPQDYTFQHLQSQEADTRRKHPLPAAFSTIQALYNRERLEEVLEDLSDHGRRKVVVVFDEAHHIGADAPKNTEVFSAVMSNSHVDIVVGMTASKVRADGQRVTDSFERTTFEATLLEAVDSGRLQKFTYIQPQADNSHLSVSQVAELSSKKSEKSRERLTAVVDDLVSRIDMIEKVRRGEMLIDQVFPGLSAEDRKLWEDGISDYWAKQILGFCNDIPSANFVRDRLREKGIKAETIFGYTPADERNRILQAYKRGEVNSIILVGVGREGLDLPQTTVGVLFGSVGSAVTLQQMFGRFLRRRQGPPTLIVDYSVPSSQEYHAELLRRQFAVDVVGQPPKEIPASSRAQAAEKASKSAKSGVDLLATIDVPADEIRLTTANIFSSKHIELVPVLPDDEVSFTIAPPPDANISARPEVVKAAEKPELPYITPILDLQLPKPERLQILLDKGVKVKADITAGAGEGAQLLGEASLRKVEEGVEFGLNIHVPESLPLAEITTIHDRLQTSLAAQAPDPTAQEWIASFAPGSGRGKGMITLPDGTEARISLEGRVLSFAVKMPTNNLVSSQQQTNQALSLLLKSAVAQEGEIALYSGLHGKTEEMLAETKVRIKVNTDELRRESSRLFRQAPLSYNFGRGAREKFREEGYNWYNELARECIWGGHSEFDGIEYHLEISDLNVYPNQDPNMPNMKILATEGRFKSSLIPWESYDAAGVSSRVVEKLKSMGFSNAIRTREHTSTTTNSITVFIDILNEAQNYRIIEGLFLQDDSLTTDFRHGGRLEITIFGGKDDPRIDPNSSIMIRWNPVDVSLRQKEVLSGDELAQHVQAVIKLQEAIFDTLVSPQEEIEIAVERLTCKQNYLHAGPDYKIEDKT